MPQLSYIHLGVAAVVCLGGGFALGYYLIRSRLEKQGRYLDEIVSKAKEEANQLLEKARKEGRESAERIRNEANTEIRDKRRKMDAQSARLEKREDSIDSKMNMLDEKERQIAKTEAKAKEMEGRAGTRLQEAEQVLEEQKGKLLEISRMSPEEAREQALDRVEKEMDRELAEYVQTRREKMREEVDNEAKEIVLEAIQRCAVDVVQEGVVSTIDLPGDEMKGRIIGREGRNIRAFEQATGVDVIVDDTPGTVVVSSFDSVRREIARRSIEKLVQDGRIHPARIEDLVAKTAGEVEKEMLDAAKKAAQQLGVAKLAARELELLGRLRFRTSYGQNCLAHSVEVAAFAGIMAGELHLNVHTARRAGLLHDIGKAVDHEVTGTHPSIGAELVKSFDEKPEIVNAVAAHHEDVPAESLYAFLIQVADAISASRPGARREDLERYIQRLQALENIATAHKGVEKAYAVHAGREVRVLARADDLSDLESERVAREIAKEVEEQLSYPGEVKITVIREKRFIEYAR
ncbi:MAG: ribonuclease Y [Planctomycetes bacterium]|nr:ribonuclease Y [Planctomycetota bacterium]